MAFDLFDGLLVALLANAIELPVIWWFSRPARLLKRFETPSEADLKSFGILFGHFFRAMMTPSVEVPVKGGEEGEVRRVSPASIMMEVAADQVVNKLRGLEGAVTKEMLKMGAMPRKGQSVSEWGLEQLLGRMMPQLEQMATRKIEELVSKRGGEVQW